MSYTISKHKFNLKSQKAKIWDFSFKFILKNKKIQTFHHYRKDITKYNQDMSNFGKWTHDYLIDLGPTFIKLGQVLSTRKDIFSKEFILELEKLQDDVMPMNSDEINLVLNNELNIPVDQIFQYLDYKPYKAASLGQVHKGILLSGKKVAVKIQRPNIRETIVNDIDTIVQILDIFDKIGLDTGPSAKKLFVEAKKNLFDELDYKLEARNAYVFREKFINNPIIICPRVYISKSTDKLLIMEWVYGTKITNIEKLKEQNIDLKIVSKNLIECFLLQIMEYGFFHADPHPGNLAITKNGDNPVIVLYDYGLVIEIPSKLKIGIGKIINYLIQRDTRKIVDILIELELIIPTADADDIVLFFDNILTYIENMDGNMLKDNLLKDKLSDSLSQQKPFLLPSSFIFLAKTFNLIEGICKQLDPDFNYYTYLESMINSNIMNNIDIEKMASNTFEIPLKIQAISKSVTNLEKQRGEIKQNIKETNDTVKNTQFYVLLSLIIENSIDSNNVEILIVMISLIVFNFQKNRR